MNPSESITSVGKNSYNWFLFKDVNAEEQLINSTFKYYVGKETDKLSDDNWWYFSNFPQRIILHW